MSDYLLLKDFYDKILNRVYYDWYASINMQERLTPYIGGGYRSSLFIKRRLRIWRSIKHGDAQGHIESLRYWNKWFINIKITKQAYEYQRYLILRFIVSMN